MQKHHTNTGIILNCREWGMKSFLHKWQFLMRQIHDCREFTFVITSTSTLTFIFNKKLIASFSYSQYPLFSLFLSIQGGLIVSFSLLCLMNIAEGYPRKSCLTPISSYRPHVHIFILLYFQEQAREKNMTKAHFIAFAQFLFILCNYLAQGLGKYSYKIIPWT